ncbi:MAG TPA: class I SAM-dependent methyltransferase [Actinomycetota bacterium]|jgi:SAM-dependent methyltransferase|nr:class I SAM-dependent methyltransferase [Actinomycetota bacterium]
MAGEAPASKGLPNDKAVEQLAREMYRAETETPGARGSTDALRVGLRDLEAQLREATSQTVPSGEPSLAAGSKFRRALKVRQFRLMRPVSRRYDRLAADLAGLAAGLAERLASTEADVRRLQRALAESGRTETAAGDPGREPLEAAGTVSDSYYWAFEQRMRGTAESIELRLRRYESYAVTLRAAAEQDHPLWIEIGCGKGEFASLLREWGWRVHGVDTSPEAIDACRAAGFDATLADGLEFLDDYMGPAPLGLSAIQVIEHIPKDRWLPFFERARMVLAPGGGLLVETINPLNVDALASSFFADVTHTWPTHPEVARLMAEHAGFATTEVVFVNEDLRGNAQDFALWATAPA